MIACASVALNAPSSWAFITQLLRPSVICFRLCKFVSSVYCSSPSAACVSPRSLRALYANTCDCRMHLAISASLDSSSLPLPPKYFTNSTWAIRWARTKQSKVVAFFMCLAKSIEINLSALMRACRRRKIRRNLRVRRTRAIRMMRELARAPPPPPSSSSFVPLS